ncbi:hypothetical protein N7448_008441 [Penicillium atrosanguineum]|uniref:Uncharacterized protein n=1 Tax=Penicillium atrosanguineum TaxID=1132637 RepID=A0A9W9GR65_9EURO|nr:uncharacterized protein N7443_000543 [Penicillium atrosanguineum]KAJ5127662.1 hypothetical protein N7448_008441 [Penicillium atrosanguineum]KAJ5147872.1 hypothetical protein N7526_001224 [Penicillium atrosanguineum]KAJ5313659.1 hypothetical protein N7443_000543 [Penicillium atrosanguineum]KAJ5330831.1 hypothetical protein N7476_000614 [Penicillium atrosanguineum]
MEQQTFRRRGLGLQGVDEQQVSPGYVLYSPLTSNTAHLVSTTGEEVHRWTLPHRAGRHARILPDGSLAYNGVHPDAPRLFPMWAKYRGGMMMQLDLNGKLLRQYSDPYAHHDQNHLDDGSILYATLEPLTPDEASRVQGGIPGSEAPGGIIYADCIKLVRPWATSNISSSADFEGEGKGGAKLLWSWRAIDHLDSEAFAAHSHYPREHWPLINSVAFDGDGNIIASSRNASSVFTISRKTGEVLWHLAAPTVSQQHCAHQITPSGDILILDNGVFRPEISVPFSRAIIVSKEKEVKWEYKDTSTGGLGFFTPFMGSAQRLGNGNVLICEAATGRIFEVTEGGTLVWEFVVPQLQDYKMVMAADELEEMERIGFSNQSNAVFRAYKYTPEEIPWLKR